MIIRCDGGRIVTINLIKTLAMCYKVLFKSVYTLVFIVNYAYFKCEKLTTK